MQIASKFDTYRQRGDWAPDAVLAPVPGYEPEHQTDTVSFFGVNLPAAQLIPAPKHCPSSGTAVWAPDAVLAPPPDSTPDPIEAKGTVNFFGAEVPAHLLFPQQDHPPAQAVPDPRVWAPDAVLAPRPGYTPDPIEAKGTVSFFGAEVPAHLLFP